MKENVKDDIIKTAVTVGTIGAVGTVWLGISEGGKCSRAHEEEMTKRAEIDARNARHTMYAETGLEALKTLRSLLPWGRI